MALSSLYFGGLGVQRDDSEGRRWYEQAIAAARSSTYRSYFADIQDVRDGIPVTMIDRVESRHLLDLVWFREKTSEDFDSLSVERDVQVDAADESHCYNAPIAAKLDGIAFYCGFQTGAGEPGRIAIFSRWGERRREAARTVPGGWASDGGHEGDFVSVRHPFDWHRGHYVIKIAVTDVAADGGRWLTMSVVTPDEGKEQPVGSLLFPPAHRALSDYVQSFAEMFAPDDSHDLWPVGIVKTGGWTLNGKPAALLRTKAHYTAAGARGAQGEYGDRPRDVILWPR